MAELSDWDVAAANNDDTPPDGAPPFTTKFSQVDNILREMMAVMARWYQDNNGTLVFTKGDENDYTTITNRIITDYSDGLTLKFVVTETNTGEATLSINSLAAKPILDRVGSPLQANALNSSVMEVTYRAYVDSFYLSSGGADTQPPISSIMQFYAQTAPLGWQQIVDSVFNDRVPLITTGIGTGVAGSWILSGLTMPHTHTYSGYSSTSGSNVNLIGDVRGGGAYQVQGWDHGHPYAWSGTTSGASLGSVASNGGWRMAYSLWIMAGRVT